MRRLELDAPNLGAVEAEHVSRATLSGFVSTFGPQVAAFEQKLGTWLAGGGVVTTQSGTAALHMALHELGVGPGDEVIVPSLTFVATVTPVLFVGATPVFVDVDPLTWTLDLDRVEQAISARTRAIIPVHLYGNPGPMEGLLELARRKSLLVVEDATESLGALYQSQPTGCLGDLGCFSFNGNKIITTGGGGAIVGRDPSRMRHLKYLVNQARGDGLPDYAEVGFNQRMTNLEAALGLAQLGRLPSFLENKRAYRREYEQVFEKAPGVRLQQETSGAQSSFWLNAVTIEGTGDVEALRVELAAGGVPTRRLFPPLHQLPPYRGFRRVGGEIAERLFSRGLCLPSSTLNAPEDVRWAAEQLRARLT